MPTWDRGEWFAWYPTVFLGDRAIGAMTTEEIGAHVLLLNHAWPTRGVLPNDDTQLAQLSRLGARWQRCRAAVLRGWKNRGTTIVNLRLAAEWERTHRRLSQARENGRAGAERRWGSGECNSTVAKPEHSPKPRAAKTYLGSPSVSVYQSTDTEESTGSKVGSSREDQASRRPVGRAPAKRKSGPPGPLDPSWRWLQANADETQHRAAMRFAAWLLRSGTRDEGMLLALVKHFVVHKPRNVFAYYTPKGETRQDIVAHASADRQIAEHERIKAEEMKSGLGRRSGMVKP